MQWIQETWALWSAEWTLKSIDEQQRNLGERTRELERKARADEIRQRIRKRPANPKRVAVSHTRMAHLLTHELRLAQLAEKVEQRRDSVIMAPLMRSVNSSLSAGSMLASTNYEELKDNLLKLNDENKQAEEKLDGVMVATQSEQEKEVLKVLTKAAEDDGVQLLEEQLNAGEMEPVSQSLMQQRRG